MSVLGQEGTKSGYADFFRFWIPKADVAYE